jgi:hypothetical protein
MRAIIGLTAAAILMGPGVRIAGAQSGNWNDRIRVSVNVGAQLTSTTFSAATTKPVYAETATITTNYDIRRGLSFDSGLLYRLTGNFGVGVALSTFGKKSDASITGSIPHPFFFNTPRTITGTASLQRTETVLHIQAAYVVVSKKWDVAIAAGPSIFNVSQDLVTDANYTEVYPYDTATFQSAVTTRPSATKLGFNAGVDVGYRFSRSIGVGGLVRFSRATVDFPLAGSASGVSLDAGGPQAAGGVRFYF